MKKDVTTEEKILSAGQRLFGKNGYSATSMADIAKEVGISKASLYYFFKNKQSLYIHILLILIVQVRDIYSVDPGKDPRKHLRSAILKTIQVSEKYGSMLMSADLSQFDTSASDYTEVMRYNYEMDNAMETFLRKCGVKQPKIATHVLSSSVYGYMQRLMYDMRDIKEEAFATYITRLLVT